MLIAGHNPPHHCHQGPSLSLMTGLFDDDDHDRPHSDDDDDEWTFCPQWTSLPNTYHACTTHRTDRCSHVGSFSETLREILWDDGGR